MHNLRVFETFGADLISDCGRLINAAKALSGALFRKPAHAFMPGGFFIF
jgi:hypothetical protein